MAVSKVRTILGTAEFATRLSAQDSEAMARTFYDFRRKTGHVVEYDAALMYAGGEAEKVIGKFDLRLYNDVQIAAKANPWENKLLNRAGVRKQLETSLNSLNLDSVQIFYLHAPDHTTPITETLNVVNELYKENKFKEFGICNYASWEVAEICTMCKIQGWIRPTVYQGMYNCLTRGIEKELLPCLRHFNMRFYVYNPLCGGVLTGKHKFEDASKSETGRFFGKGWPELYRKRYWRKEVFDAVDKMRNVVNEVYGSEVSLTEASLRWLYHHSKLDGASGDGVVLGASKMEYFNTNTNATVQGPLDERVVQVIDECWDACCFSCPNYFR